MDISSAEQEHIFSGLYIILACLAVSFLKIENGNRYVINIYRWLNRPLNCLAWSTVICWTLYFVSQKEMFDFWCYQLLNIYETFWWIWNYAG